MSTVRDTGPLMIAPTGAREDGAPDDVTPTGRVAVSSFAPIPVPPPDACAHRRSRERRIRIVGKAHGSSDTSRRVSMSSKPC